jgi:mono/diheme cytochrome c family protein
MKPLIAIVVLVASLQSLAAGQNLSYRPDPKWHVPPETISRPNPLAQKPNLAGGGRKLFLRHCAECHGEGGHGLRHAADLQLPVVQNQADGALFWKITNGNPKHGMPGWSRLPELQRWQLVLFLRSLSSAQSP